jgi:hypothetical protein
MARVVQKLADGRHFTFIWKLIRTLRIEADDDEYVGAAEKIAVDKRCLARGGTALDTANGISRADPHILAEQGIVRQKYIVEKPGYTLIEVSTVRQVFILRPLQPAQLEQRAEPVVQVAERSALLVRPAPGEVHQDVWTNHQVSLSCVVSRR